MKSRNYSLDLLRMFAMFLVATLHTLGHGGLLESAIPYSHAYYMAWLIETFALCAVNCYGILSGYVGVESNYRYSNFILIWLQAFLYSAGFTLVLGYLGKIELSSDVLKSAFFPVINGEYWYLTAYAGLFFVIPLLNRAFLYMTQRQIRAIFTTCIVIFCFLPTLFHTDPFKLGGGYSVIWLTLLYIIGGCLKKGQIFATFKHWLWFVIYVLCAGGAWVFKYLIERHLIQTQMQLTDPNLLMAYTAPTMLFAAIALFFIFEKMHLPAFITKFVKVLSPAAFGVYLIHDNRKIRKLFIKGISSGLSEVGPVTLVFSVFKIVVKIYVICLLIDLVRHYVFKFFKLRERLQKLENKLLGELW